ncbi:phospho-sugar mutase [Pseudonocardia sediminis]|nr:phospho-sugar mutase [Pseudonocardia sediminis]
MRWIADDPDPSTRDELQRVLVAAMTGGTAPDGPDATGPVADLADRMSGPLRFGTAGLRGPVRAGPSGMNVAVVRRATSGLATWLVEQGQAGRTVVVGRDARHGSAAFADAAAGVLAGAGFAVALLDGAVPTPVLAFAVRHLGAVAGVQVTASHNPAGDNGYKVYLGNGAQIVPPVDAQIEAAIAAAPPAVSVDVASPPPPVSVTGSYLDRVVALPRTGATALRIALTPLHGVGGQTCVHALSRSGFSDVRVVASQAAPDPDFPTVAFPNPEEPGATDAVLALAADVGADLAVALDPDADRCALGVEGPDGWRMLTGDETGVLLADHVLRHTTSDDPLVATTVVSSSMLRPLAESHGARFAETLTGFKWIVRGGPGLVYGYEEALGYCVDPAAVLDKDGIAACVLAADLAASLRADGATLLDRLDELAVAHGVHLTRGRSVRMDPAERDAAVARLREHPPSGWDLDRPAPDVLRLRRDGARVVIRPSGTEPKLKTYLEVVEHPDGPDGLADARSRAERRLTELHDEVDTLLADDRP